MSSPLLLLPALSALLLPEVSVFEYTLAPRGNVRVVDEGGILPDQFPEDLQGIELLPLDFIGRTHWELLSLERPRLRESLEAPRLRLPGGQGSLYAYRRAEPEETNFGFFLVDSEGTPRVLLEVTGIGLGGEDHPFCPKLACEDGGGSLLIGTLPEAGGDLFEIDLQSGTVENRTATISPRTLLTNGMALLEGYGLALTPQGLLRFERGPGNQARNVSFGGGTAAHARMPAGQAGTVIRNRPDWFGSDIVTSADGSTAAFYAGPGPTASHVWIVRRLGRPERVTEAPQSSSGANFLPESPIGPTLALAPDGSCVAWRVENAISAETFVDRVGPQPTPAQLTADAHYSDTLNDSGVIAFASPDELVMLVGETDNNDPLQIDGADLYRVNIADLATPSFTNLSLTSGDAVAPFLEAGTLDTDAGLARTSPASALVLGEDDMGSGRLLELDLGTGQVTSLFDQVKEWTLAARSGNDLVLGLRREFDSLDQELYRWPAGAAPALVFSQSGGGYFDWARRPGQFAGVAVDNTNLERLGRVELASGTSESMPPASEVGPTLDYTSNGALAYSMESLTQSFYQLWNSDSSITTLHVGAGKGFLLPRD